MVPSPTEIKDISSPKSWVRSIALIGSNGSSEAILHLQPGILLTAEIQIARTNPPAAQSLFKLAPLLKGTVCALQDGTHLVYTAVTVHPAHSVFRSASRYW